MRAEESWRPTKFELRKGRWRATREQQELAPASRLMANRAVAAYTTAIHNYARGSLLDVGCGKAPLYGAYRPRVDTITCIDWGDSPHLDIEHNLSRTPWPLEDASFDTLLATDVLEHLPYPDSFFAEARRLLRPGGRLILGVPFMYWIHEGPHDYQRYTEHRLRLFCDDHELRVMTCEPYGGGLDVLVDVAGKALSSVPLLRAASAFMQVPATRRGVDVMPLGYVLVAQA